MKRWQEIALFSVLVPMLVGGAVAVCSAGKKCVEAEDDAKVKTENPIGSIHLTRDTRVRVFDCHEGGVPPGGSYKHDGVVIGVMHHADSVTSGKAWIDIYEVFDWHDKDKSLGVGKHVWYRITPLVHGVCEWWVYGAGAVFSAEAQGTGHPSCHPAFEDRIRDLCKKESK